MVLANTITGFTKCVCVCVGPYVCVWRGGEEYLPLPLITADFGIIISHRKSELSYGDEKWREGQEGSH